MKLSTNSRYGLRALVDLAANYRGAPVALCDIARRQKISESYLEQAFGTLRKAGFVRSSKGAQGGYAPAGDPAQIPAGAVLRALEGDLKIVENSPVYRGGDAIKRSIRENLWDAVDQRLSALVDSITLEDLAREYMRMRGNAHEYEQ
mgnify:CR=1 FL=1